jgi:hypothetical protein
VAPAQHKISLPMAIHVTVIAICTLAVYHSDTVQLIKILAVLQQTTPSSAQCQKPERCRTARTWTLMPHSCTATLYYCGHHCCALNAGTLLPMMRSCVLLSSRFARCECVNSTTLQMPLVAQLPASTCKLIQIVKDCAVPIWLIGAPYCAHHSLCHDCIATDCC